MDDAELREWAQEHLLYEADTIKYATEQLGLTGKGEQESVLLQSFVVNARCLNDFLWRDRNPNHPRDAFAADFCPVGVWEAVRRELPQANLEDIRKRRRFGREVMHLTYDRISGYGEEKEWPCGRVFAEVAVALAKFADEALPDLLSDETRGRLRGLLSNRTSPTGLTGITGATGISLSTTGGIVDVANINAGGKQ